MHSGVTQKSTATDSSGAGLSMFWRKDHKSSLFLSVQLQLHAHKKEEKYHSYNHENVFSVNEINRVTF